MHRRRFLILAGVAAGGAILTACGGGNAATVTPKPAPSPTAPAATTAAGSATASGGIQTVMIEAFDYGYRTLGSIPGGLTRVQMKNTGKELHHAQFMQLNPGVTVDQVGAAFQKGPDEAFKLVTFVGGPGAVAPTLSTEVILDLKAGQHMIGCFIAGADHIPHLAKGMLMPLMVTAPAAVASPAPVVAGTITLMEFTFDMPATLPAGRSMWRVVNPGAQAHEFNIVQIAPGKTLDDLKTFVDPPTGTPPAGPPSGAPVGGMNALTRGMSAIAVLDLTPGNYAAICNVPDQSKPNGESHLHLGMIKGFTVK
jgi:hypothetical protein